MPSRQSFFIFFLNCDSLFPGISQFESSSAFFTISQPILYILLHKWTLWFFILSIVGSYLPPSSPLEELLYITLYFLLRRIFHCVYSHCVFSFQNVALYFDTKFQVSSHTGLYHFEIFDKPNYRHQQTSRYQTDSACLKKHVGIQKNKNTSGFDFQDTPLLNLWQSYR